MMESNGPILVSGAITRQYRTMLWSIVFVLILGAYAWSTAVLFTIDKHLRAMNMNLVKIIAKMDDRIASLELEQAVRKALESKN